MGSAPEPRDGAEPPPLTTGGRAAALLEILLCSDYPDADRAGLDCSRRSDMARSPGSR